MIKATGKRNGVKMTVEYIDGEFWYDGKLNPALDKEMQSELDECYVFAGTYVPEKPDDPLNIVSVLGTHWFDRAVIVEDDEGIELPCEEGVVY